MSLAVVNAVPAFPTRTAPFVPAVPPAPPISRSSPPVVAVVASPAPPVSVRFPPLAPIAPPSGPSTPPVPALTSRLSPAVSAAAVEIVTSTPPESPASKLTSLSISPSIEIVSDPSLPKSTFPFPTNAPARVRPPPEVKSEFASPMLVIRLVFRSRFAVWISNSSVAASVNTSLPAEAPRPIKEVFPVVIFPTDPPSAICNNVFVPSEMLIVSPLFIVTVGVVALHVMSPPRVSVPSRRVAVLTSKSPSTPRSLSPFASV